jgi:uncharacterized protein YuzE
MAENNILKAIPYLLLAPSKRIWIDYDDTADVLYISFRKPQQANDSIMENNVVYHYHDDNLVGLTILQAKHTFALPEMTVSKRAEPVLA